GKASGILGQKFAELFRVCRHCEEPMGDEAISCRFSSAARDCFASLAMTRADLSYELWNQDTRSYAASTTRVSAVLSFARQAISLRKNMVSFAFDYNKLSFVV